MTTTTPIPAGQTPQSSGFQPDLVKYLQASQRKLRTCITEVQHNVALSSPAATMHLQYVKFDPTNGEPKFDVLAKILAKHIVQYALSASTRAEVHRRLDYEEDEGELFMIARNYFRKVKDSGEVGELLLFFLLEAAFEAPQVVCKMELKTNLNEEVKGVDGIHVKWDQLGNRLDVYLGESKLFQDISGAITSTFDSITEFHDLERMDEELHLVTSHFKHLDANLKTAITRFINRESSEKECRIVHACLIGFDWGNYKNVVFDQQASFIQKFEDDYGKYASSIQRMLDKRFGNCRHKHLSFKFLFLPFKSVSEFRRAFYKELCGVEIGPANA